MVESKPVKQEVSGTVILPLSKYVSVLWANIMFHWAASIRLIFNLLQNHPWFKVLNEFAPDQLLPRPRQRDLNLRSVFSVTNVPI